VPAAPTKVSSHVNLGDQSIVRPLHRGWSLVVASQKDAEGIDQIWHC
jgi:hypothetical protein